jgi:hypothetical protein
MGKKNVFIYINGLPAFSLLVVFPVPCVINA